MRILIDFTQIPIQKMGVGVYALQMFKLLFEKDKINKYIAFIQGDDQDFTAFNHPNVKIVKINSFFFRRFMLRIIFEQFFLPLYCFRYRINILHSLHYSFPIVMYKTKRIVTVHDLTFFLYPHLHTFIKRYYFRLFISFASKLADEIICVSESTASDLKKLFPRIKANIQVIPLAVDNQLTTFSDSERNSVLEKFNIKEDYILFVGTLEPRKNLEHLIKAYNLICASNPNISLVIVGKKGWFYDSIFNLVEKLKLNAKIIFTGYVSEYEKFILLSLCRLFVYPSLYEGFGLPILEAFLFEKPTITSNISSMPEVAGDAAILVNPTNIEELSSAMNLLLNDKVLCDNLISKTRNRTLLFTWDNTAVKTLYLYNLVANI